MNIEEIENLARSMNSLCFEAKRSAKDKLYNYFVENHKEIDTGCFSLDNYIIEYDGDLYFLKKWAEAKTRYWGNHEVVSVVYDEKEYAYTTAHRIKLDGTLSANETKLVMVVDGFEDEEAGYLNYHFELDEDGVEL